MESGGSRQGLTPLQWRVLTAAIWTISLTCLLLAGLLAAEFALMPVSLDIGEMLTAGAEPWRDAAIAAAGFLVLLVAAAVGLRLWHTVRFRKVAWLLTAGEVAAVAWACAIVARDYL